MTRVSVSGLAALRLRHLQLIEGLVDFGSLHQAARAMDLTESAASAMLREVEAACGTDLFDRSVHGLSLTQAGQVALGRLKAISSEVNMLTQELLQTETVPVLRVGALQHIFFGLLQTAVPALLARTDCKLELIDCPSAELANALQQDEVDCILCRMPDEWVESFQSPAFFYDALYDEDICVVCAPNHPLARTDAPLMMEDLVGEKWILQKPGTHQRHVLITAFVSQGLQPPEATIETSSFVFTLPFLQNSRLLTVATRDHSVSYEWSGQVRVLPIRLPQLSPPIAFIAKKRSMSNPTVLALWEELRRAQNPPPL